MFILKQYCFRNNVNRIFECFCEIISPNKENTKPWILQKFPEHYRKEEMLNIVPDFAYPCDFAFPCDFDKYFFFLLLIYNT